MFITHFHLLAIYTQVVKIYSTVHEAIRRVFRSIETPKHDGRDHERVCNYLREVVHEIRHILDVSQRLPVRPLGMAEQADLEHFDRSYTYV